MIKRMAVIDFGTNTARLLIADRTEGGAFQHVHLQREVVRMGGGFTREKGLSSEAMQRGLACLTRFAAVIREYNVPVVLAVATSAVRDAVNGVSFVNSVLQKAGIELKVIDGISEGNLTLAGVLSGLDRNYNEILVFDIGGGSTEYTLARLGCAAFVHSLPLGVVRLTEGKDTLEAVELKIRKELDVLYHHMRLANCRILPDTLLVGTAGTATTLAAINMGMRDYDYRKVNNSTISKGEITSILNRLLPLTPSERLNVPGLEKGREDLIISGILIVLRTMELFGMKTLKVSDYGLLEGLIVSGETVVGKHGA